MFEWIRQKVLRFMRVPHAPEPPFGAPGSVRIFRAGQNYYKLRLIGWGVGQVGAIVGLVVSLAFLTWFRSEVESSRLARALAANTAPVQPPPAPVQPLPPSHSSPPAAGPAGVQVAPASTAPVRKAPRLKRTPRQDFKVLAGRTPWWVIVLFEALEVWGILLFLLQLPVTFAAVRLNFELHWYIVTDRSLRIRTGLVRLQEATMSFANLQQVEVKQGPLQRLLGLADVHVQSAGGAGANAHGQVGESLHTGIFHSVSNATEIRDLILERLRVFRQAGLGDPDDHNHHPGASAVPGDALAAAHELLAEARALRAAFE